MAYTEQQKRHVIELMRTAGSVDGGHRLAMQEADFVGLTRKQVRTWAKDRKLNLPAAPPRVPTGKSQEGQAWVVNKLDEIVNLTAARIVTEIQQIPVHILPTLLGIAVDKREKLAAPQGKASSVTTFHLEINFKGPEKKVIDVPIYHVADRIPQEAEPAPSDIS